MHEASLAGGILKLVEDAARREAFRRVTEGRPGFRRNPAVFDITDTNRPLYRRLKISCAPNLNFVNKG